jgi:hypothetical protein
LSADLEDMNDAGDSEGGSGTTTLAEEGCSTRRPGFGPGWIFLMMAGVLTGIRLREWNA